MTAQPDAEWSRVGRGLRAVASARGTFGRDRSSSAPVGLSPLYSHREEGALSVIIFSTSMVYHRGSVCVRASMLVCMCCNYSSYLVQPGYRLKLPNTKYVRVVSFGRTFTVVDCYLSISIIFKIIHIIL